VSATQAARGLPSADRPAGVCFPGVPRTAVRRPPCRCLPRPRIFQYEPVSFSMSLVGI